MVGKNQKKELIRLKRSVNMLRHSRHFKPSDAGVSLDEKGGVTQFQAIGKGVFEINGNLHRYSELSKADLEALELWTCKQLEHKEEQPTKGKGRGKWKRSVKYRTFKMDVDEKEITIVVSWKAGGEEHANLTA